MRVHPFVTFSQPLERKLPILIATLLCAVVGAFGWLGEREVERALVTTAADRVATGAQRFSAMLAESAAALRREAAQIAGDSAVVAALDRPGEVPRSAAALVLLGRRPAPAPAASRALWTTGCQLVLVTGPAEGGAETACPRAAAGGGTGLDRDWVQPLRARGDSVRYMLVAPVLRGARDTIGYFVQVRSFGAGAWARMLAGVIGADATLLIGNASGPPLWTNLERRVAPPPPTPLGGGVTRYTPVGGSEQFGVTLPVASTPWMVAVQMPVSTALAGLYQVRRTMAGFAVLCVMLGVLGAWLLGNHVTGPIVELTRAGEEFAAGNYSRRVTTGRRDELGQLVAAFNRMAAHVDVATHELSAQAEELEHRFRESQDLAHELELSNRELSEAARETMLAHRERASAQSLLDDVLTQSPVAIAVFDAALCFVRVNHAFAAMDGHAEAGHAGQRLDAVMPAIAPFVEPQLRRVLETGRVMTNQRFSHVRHDGSRSHWLGTCFPVRGPQGEVRGAGVVLVDSTAHVELEAQLLQAQKMDAVGRLAGGVAHDFNNLLTVISSYSELALESLSPHDDLYADMKEIRSAAERASRLTKQLLAFSRKQVMQPQVLDLNYVASDMERMLRRLIGDGVVFTLDPGADLGDVCADAGQVEQVIMNLALNARDAMPAGGNLVIRTANLTLASDQRLDTVTVPAGEYVTLSVSDSGTGIAEGARAHIFEPFFTTKATGQGTGLGLSTVYGIVKQSGGEIAVRPTPGGGSTFIVFLPRAPRDAPCGNRGVFGQQVGLSLA